MLNTIVHKLEPKDLNGNDILVVRKYAGLATNTAEYYDKVGVKINADTIENVRRANRAVYRAIDNIKG